MTRLVPLLLLFGCPVSKRRLDDKVDADGDGAIGAEWGGPDCDDGDPAVGYPGAQDAPGDEVDQDCDGALACYADDDHDGVAGPRVTAEPGCVPGQPTGDCDDDDSDVFPGGDELDGGGDDDCDGELSCFVDGDGDGYPGPEAATVDAEPGQTCSELDGYGEAPTDCDDAHEEAFPGGDEDFADDVDEDCDGDLDGDGLDAEAEALVGGDPLDADTDDDTLTDDVDPAADDVDADDDGVCDGPLATDDPGCTSVWYVKVGGAGGGASWADALGSAQAALDGAHDGDELRVFEGDYDVVDAELAEDVTVSGGYTDVADEGARDGDTVFDADGAGRVLTLADGDVLDGVHVTGGSDPPGVGGCLLIDEPGAEVRLVRVTAEDCEAQTGGVVANRGHLTIESSVLRDGRSQTGGVVWSDGPLDVVQSTLELGGGGVLWTSGPTTVVASVLTTAVGPTATDVVTVSGSATFRMLSSEVRDGADGVASTSSQPLELAGCAFSDLGGAAIAATGAVNLRLSSVDVAAGVVAGGGVVVDTASSGAVFTGLTATNVCTGLSFVVSTGRIYLPADLSGCPQPDATDASGAFQAFSDLPAVPAPEDLWIRDGEVDGAPVSIGAHYFPPAGPPF